MASEKGEPDNFLSVIEAKIAALKTLADSYRTALSLGALGQPGDIDMSALASPAGGRPDMPIELPHGAFLGKSLPVAVKLYLTAVRRKQTIREIATALKEGGVESTSDNFENVVTGAVHRLKAAGEVLRFKDGWALAEFYPASIRASLSTETKDSGPKKKRRQKTPKATVNAKAGKPTRTAAGRSHSSRPKAEGGLESRIESYVREHAADWAEVAQAMKANPGTVRMVLGKLVKRQRVIKLPDTGLYVANLTTEPRLRAV